MENLLTSFLDGISTEINEAFSRYSAERNSVSFNTWDESGYGDMCESDLKHELNNLYNYCLDRGVTMKTVDALFNEQGALEYI